MIVEGNNLMSVARPFLRITIIYGTFNASFRAVGFHFTYNKYPTNSGCNIILRICGIVYHINFDSILSLSYQSDLIR